MIFLLCYSMILSKVWAYSYLHDFTKTQFITEEMCLVRKERKVQEYYKIICSFYSNLVCLTKLYSTFMLDIEHCILPCHWWLSFASSFQWELYIISLLSYACVYVICFRIIVSKLYLIIYKNKSKPQCSSS